MTIEELTAKIESMGGVLISRPGPGDGSPEIAWGDSFFYYAPDGVVPPGQPFATIVTKDYPGEPSSGLDDGVFRVNVDAGRAPAQSDAGDGAPEATVRDVVIPHPAYAAYGWVSVVAPGPRTHTELRALLTEAHARAKRSWERRQSVRDSD